MCMYMYVYIYIYIYTYAYIHTHTILSQKMYCRTRCRDSGRGKNTCRPPAAAERNNSLGLLRACDAEVGKMSHYYG